MELFPIIYTSLLIAAGIFLITVIISYVSYKVRQNNTENEGPAASVTTSKPAYTPEKKPAVRPEYTGKYPAKEKYSNERRKEIKEEEFYRHSSKSSSSNQNEKYSRKDEPGIKASSSIRKIEPERRIEILKDLKSGRGEDANSAPARPSNNKDTEDKRKTQEDISADNKDRKKLKSINDDPLNKYSDSSDNDDFQPLKTDN